MLADDPLFELALRRALRHARGGGSLQIQLHSGHDTAITEIAAAAAVTGVDTPHLERHAAYYFGVALGLGVPPLPLWAHGEPAAMPALLFFGTQARARIGCAAALDSPCLHSSHIGAVALHRR